MTVKFCRAATQQGPVTDDIDIKRKILFFYVSFGQTHGMVIVHNYGKQHRYGMYQKGVKWHEKTFNAVFNAHRFACSAVKTTLNVTFPASYV